MLSVGVDIGSSTSHLVFSRIVLERLDTRYVVTEREIFYQSDILLTPYADADAIDADALGAFIAQHYKNAMVDPDEIDAGALILTGVAVRRSNARAIGELFAREAGKLVAVSAGDSLETVMAAYGSGAVARSIRDGTAVMNVDVGGGTVQDRGVRRRPGRGRHRGRCRRAARLHRRGRHASRGSRKPAAGSPQSSGSTSSSATTLGRAAARLAARMADCLFEAMRGGSPELGDHRLLRLDPLGWHGQIGQVMFSGGVSEYIYGRESEELRRSRRRAGAPRSARASPAGARRWSRRRRASAPP